jgi:hypothetical protein
MATHKNFETLHPAEEQGFLTYTVVSMTGLTAQMTIFG